MKTCRLIVFSLLLSISSLAGLLAQSLPNPGNNAGEWIVREVTPRFKSEMPILKPNSGYEDKMILKIASLRLDAKTGQLANFYDAEKGLAYDFHNGILTDTHTGKVYQFYKKGESPQPYPPQSDVPNLLIAK